MKKRITIKIIVLYIVGTSLNSQLMVQTCYGVWLESFYKITSTLLADIEHCNSVLIGKNTCLDEAYSFYDKALWEAGNNFIEC